MQAQPLIARPHERRIVIGIAYQAFALLGNVGFDPVYGARPLKRAIQTQLENPLAQKILAGEFTGGDRIRVDAEAGKLVFQKSNQGAALNRG